jgi:hypothetical protein
VPSTRKKSEDIKIAGKVVWINAEGFGVQFYKQLPA